MSRNVLVVGAGFGDRDGHCSVPLGEWPRRVAVDVVYHSAPGVSIVADSSTPEVGRWRSPHSWQLVDCRRDMRKGRQE
jgi:hypothetical protein